MPQFHETGYGERFFKQQLPSLIKSLDKIAVALTSRYTITDSTKEYKQRDNMCVITDEKNIVVSVSLIPGLGKIPVDYHVYFPFKGDIPSIGDTYEG